MGWFIPGPKDIIPIVGQSQGREQVVQAIAKFAEMQAAEQFELRGFVAQDDKVVALGRYQWRIKFTGHSYESFNDPVEGLTVSAAVGPCGVAALTKTQVIATDVKLDPLWKSCAIRPLLLAHGFRSQWSTPIYSRDGRVLGTSGIFQHNPSSSTQLQLDLIAQVTHIASTVIERALNEAALKRSEVFLAEGQRLSSTGSFSWRVATGKSPGQCSSVASTSLRSACQ